MYIHHGMKKLTPGNWRQPDISKWFSELTEDMWIAEVMRPQLNARVPEEVIRMFEVARGSIAYGWYFYPLLTLASEQLYRVQEAAVRERCKLAGIPLEEAGKDGKLRARRFADLLRDLKQRGIVPAESHIRWDAVRKLRNASSHPQKQSIMLPAEALGGIEGTVWLINQLFGDVPDYFSEMGKRVRRLTGLDEAERAWPVVVGIDVGGRTKGFHLVALRRTEILGTFATTSPNEATEWCGRMAAEVVAVDAPCGWSAEGERGGREAERILAKYGYSAFQTPTRERAGQSDFFKWMLNGEALYASLTTQYPIYRGEDRISRQCFETYPYLASCAFAGRKLKADDKRFDRRGVIRAAGMDDRIFTNGDLVDAAICALVANAADADHVTAFGNLAGGFLVTPHLC